MRCPCSQQCRISPRPRHRIERQPPLHQRIQQHAQRPCIRLPPIILLPHQQLWRRVILAAAAGRQQGRLRRTGYPAGEPQIRERDDRAVEGLPVGDVGVRSYGDVEQDVLELDVAVDNKFLVEVSHCGDELREDAADEARGEGLEVGACDFEEVAAWAVVHDEEGARAVGVAEGFEVHDGGMLCHFHDLDFALEGDFDAGGVCAAGGAVVDDFDGDETLGAELDAFHCDALFAEVDGGVVSAFDLSDGEVNGAEGALAKFFDGLVAPGFAVGDTFDGVEFCSGAFCGGLFDVVAACIVGNCRWWGRRFRNG